ncbi:hypothetical protein BYT27DRAFT_7204023 [Phlegmacium glaucopus]|nr:hypothetical protein BYT27DRAFT_7204023 [Phlegmacium glaucopus]
MVYGKENGHRTVDYSDSESQTLGKPALKRQKVEKIDDADMDRVPYNPQKNTHLKGRKRFSADFADSQEACASGLVLHGLKLKKIRRGEDDGSFEVVIENCLGKHILSATLLVSDTSEYPGNHSLFCYSADADIPAKIQRIVDEAAEESPRTIGDTIGELMASLSRAIGSAPIQYQTISDDDDAHSSTADYDDYDDYDDIGNAPVEPNSIMAKLQEDFVDIVATDYRPGFIRLGGNDFLVSVSLPVITLSNSIPPHALMAWDRRLLSCSQHLTLLISGFHGLYPVLENDISYNSSAQRLGVSLGFKVGLSQKYKPGSEQAQEIVRKHGLIIQDAEDELRIQAEWAAQQQRNEWLDDLNEDEPMPAEAAPEEEEIVDEGRFDSFSLSCSLESLMDQSFLKIVQLRRKFDLGWAGAELLHSEIERSQQLDQEVLKMNHDEILQADSDERKIGATVLPHDPLLGLRAEDPFNLPLTAFCYLVRRISLCPRYCLVCHNKLGFDYGALKPYVCDSKLCSYQYYSLNRGPSLEYEIIHNPLTVDLLVSLAYASASDGAMDEPLPVGLGLRVPPPSSSGTSGLQQPPPYYVDNTIAVSAPSVPKTFTISADGLCEFDELDLMQMRLCIVKLISTLPSIEEMKKHLERKVKAGKSKPKLKEIDPNVLPAAWSILRWCVASCTAHIEAISSGEELIKNLDPSWRQFRLTVGAPDAEAKFKTAINEAVQSNANAKVYPVIYAFHGSPLRNWHSIIRHGLWYKTIAHGRAFGDGVYLAKDASTSMGYYATARASWQKSLTGPVNCMALTEVVNLPSQFVSSNPHYVIKDTHWIMCRYLLVKGAADGTELSTSIASKSKASKASQIPFVKLDPKHQTSVGLKVIEIPDPAFQVESLLAARKADYVHEEPDEEDLAIFQLDSSKPSRPSQHEEYGYDDDDDYAVPAASSSSIKTGPVQRPADDWKHNAEWVISILGNLMPPPIQSTPSASMAIQRELKSMLKEQELAPNLRDLGWYMPPDLIGDNLYQWFVEMHSLDPSLPIAKDMKARKLNSMILEIRFPPTFPNSPPFFRIISPRFLPFIQGGGGHVTGGGSICMDLLTSDGWLPSYSISAVLMQIRLAISNLEPRPARLASDWNRPYGIDESLVGYKRAAATHGWTLPPGLDRLVR